MDGVDYWAARLAKGIGAALLVLLYSAYVLVAALALWFILGALVTSAFTAIF